MYLSKPFQRCFTFTADIHIRKNQTTIPYIRVNSLFSQLLTSLQLTFLSFAHPWKYTPINFLLGYRAGNMKPAPDFIHVMTDSI